MAAIHPVKSSRQLIQHPGIASIERRRHARGRARHSKLRLAAGANLMDAIASGLRTFQGGAAFLCIDGLKFSNCRFVLPAGARDERHVAWYSDPVDVAAPSILHGTAVIGRRNGQWFAHCHAAWVDANGAEGMGHLLCSEARIAEDLDAEILLFTGAGLEVALDAETNFPLMRVVEAIEPSGGLDAVLLTIKPHEDLRRSIEEVASEIGMPSARVLGIGSLIGAGFAEGHSMSSLLSEILLLPGARIRASRCAELPICCVTPSRELFKGDLLTGQGAVLMTCELLLVNESRDAFDPH